MNRLQEFDRDVKEITVKSIRQSMPNPSYIDADFCANPHAPWFECLYQSVLIFKGAHKQWISDNGFVICKKHEATCLLTIGEKADGGLWKKGYKNFWLKPVNY